MNCPDESRLDTIRTLFSERNLRCTSQRLAVFEALAGTRSHPTAEELRTLANDRGVELSLATVYNTLEAFCSAGIATRLPSPNGSCRFDANTDPHLHISFRDSDTIVDVPTDLSRRLLDRVPADVLSDIERTLGIEIESLNIELVARPIRSSSDLSD